VRSPYGPTKSEKQRPGVQAGGIVAKLSDSNRCTALGLTAQSSAPVIVLCRALIDTGHDPATPMQVFRGETLALTVRAIGEAARLEINAKGTGFVPRHAVRTAPPMRGNALPCTGHGAMPEAAE
jgi:hypothetical protein